MDEKIMIILKLDNEMASKLSDIAQYKGFDMPFMLKHLIEIAHGKHERRLEAIYMEAERRKRFPHLYEVNDEIPF
jgi:hypothetical protein